jgi:hypothetical protein
MDPLRPLEHKYVPGGENDIYSLILEPYMPSLEDVSWVKECGESCIFLLASIPVTILLHHERTRYELRRYNANTRSDCYPAKDIQTTADVTLYCK